LDTWGPYFGQDVTHGTPFRNAFNEGLFIEDSSIHVGIRGSTYEFEDIIRDNNLGFKVITCYDKHKMGLDGIIDRIRNRVKGNNVYISIDIDVLDPAFASGTGTPEVGGFTSSEFL